MVVEADDAIHSLYRAGTQTPVGDEAWLAGSKDGVFRNHTKQAQSWPVLRKVSTGIYLTKHTG